jgi:hypothetical protein
MNGYVIGILIEVGIGIAKCIRGWRELRSQRAKNMAKIDLKYSCLRGGYVPLETRIPTFPEYVFWCVVICPLASWVAVAADLAVFGYLKFSYVKPPPEILELQSKVSRSDLTREELLSMLEELRGFYEKRVA